jgi:epoxyqueuosine reductase
MLFRTVDQAMVINQQNYGETFSSSVLPDSRWEHPFDRLCKTLSGESGMPLDRQTVLGKARDLGFHLAGIAAVPEQPDEAEQLAAQRLDTWLAMGYQADMAWMAAPRRQNIRRLMPSVRSVISVAINYYTPHQQSADPRYGKISRYGWGRDYHRVLEKRLKALAIWLHTLAEAEQVSLEVRYYVDTGPVQDKFWAQQAGLGWIAKNGNVITRDYGSWVFLGELLTNLPLVPDRPHAEHCGTCTRCLDACPTQAITRPFVVDANRCIAYHTIENRAATLPEEISPHLQTWVAGCDICQEVCPWNQRFAQPTEVEDFQPYAWNLAPPLTDLATLSVTDWDRRFRASALRRIKPDRWRRNARAAQSPHSGER